ncbi:hormogonium polysaccharide biosynthesis glycosyltransferase HpsE [Spirulina subsalsa]|uniref:hormogonium polysaccharide biosynthesis glycosyltransferase HpsE n=1 Tax=Spirulina subsalsa TaxID=54311 RepID=UPI0003084685|nr:hormogonium polysaccharide biosynthesis glycosyltransferase HpsE [Spirulina subsalsa]
MVDFTVAICTYNGAKRLPDVLDKLKACIESGRRSHPTLTWEIRIINNNSTDETQQVIEQYQTQWTPDVPIYTHFEAQQGLAFARQCAVEQAQGEWIGFLDDDNLPTENWIVSAYEFGREYPQAGAFGGLVKAAFEDTPPPGIERIQSFLAIVERGNVAFQYQLKTGLLPPGAGLVVRKDAWLSSVPKQLFLKGRIGEVKLASEDLEAVSLIQQKGWEIWHNPQMEISHKIPESRLQLDYLLTLIRGTGLARHHIRMTRLTPWQRPLAFLIYFCNDLRCLLLFWLKNSSQIHQDLVTTCQWEWLRSSLMSPFYLWSQGAIYGESSQK